MLGTEASLTRLVVESGTEGSLESLVEAWLVEAWLVEVGLVEAWLVEVGLVEVGLVAADNDPLLSEDLEVYLSEEVGVQELESNPQFGMEWELPYSLLNSTFDSCLILPVGKTSSGSWRGFNMTPSSRWLTGKGS